MPICKNFLSFSISQALACGASLHDTNLDSKKILLFGLIHLFVISGYHINILDDILASFKLNKYVRLALLFTYALFCGFTPPTARAFFQKLIKSTNYFLPSFFIILISFLMTLPIAFYQQKFSSLLLSYVFCSIIVFTKNLSFKTLLVYALAYPIFTYHISLPHISNILLLPFFTLIVEFVLFPLALISFLIDSAEILILIIWHQLESILTYFYIFFNFPSQAFVNFHSKPLFKIMGFYFMYASLLYFLEVLWKRRSYLF